MSTSAPAGTAITADLPPFLSLLSRAWATLRRPRAAMTAAVARPRPQGMLVFLTLLTVGPGTLLMTTGVGRQALVDEWERTAAAFGRDVGDAGYAQLHRRSRHAPWWAAGRGLLVGPILASGIAAGLHLTLGRRTDRARPFATALAVATHAGMPLAVRELLGAPVNYMRESTTNVFTLGSWVPSLDIASPPARLLGALDLFGVWTALLIALGASIAYQRRFRTLAAVTLGIYGGLGLLVALVLWIASGA